MPADGSRDRCAKVEIRWTEIGCVPKLTERTAISLLEGDVVKPHLALRGSHSSPGCFILAQWSPRGCIKQICLVSSATCCIRLLQQPLDICALVGMQAMQVLRWQLGRVQASRVPFSCSLHRSLRSRWLGWRHELHFL